MLGLLLFDFDFTFWGHSTAGTTVAAATEAATAAATTTKTATIIYFALHCWCGTVFGSPTSSTTTITIAYPICPSPQPAWLSFPFSSACAWPRRMPLATSPCLALLWLASPLGQRLKLTSLTSCLSSLFHPQAALFLPPLAPAHFHCHANARSRAHTHFHFILSSLCWTGANALSAST